MIDTVALKSPPIDEGLAVFLEKQCILKQGIELSSGSIIYEITNGQLRGSWDSRISFKICREDYKINANGRPELYPCLPFIAVECSLHKFFYGQNVFGNPCDFQTLCKAFLMTLGSMFASSDNFATYSKRSCLPDSISNDEGMFPDPMTWEVRRVDWAEVFKLPPTAIAEFFRTIKNCKFPRRAVKEAKYSSAVHFPGKTTTLRIYHKGPEFKLHDASRIKTSINVYYAKQTGGKLTDAHFKKMKMKCDALQRLANNRLRSEIQINGEKLYNDFAGRYPKVSEINDDYLINIYENEMFKLFKEGKSEMDTVRTYDRVQARLNDLYGSRSANNLFAFWLKLAARGEEVTRIDYSKSQFYSNRKKLVDAGISWLASDVLIIDQETALPRGFTVFRSDERRCVGSVSLHSVFALSPVEQVMLAA